MRVGECLLHIECHANIMLRKLAALSCMGVGSAELVPDMHKLQTCLI